MVPDHQPDTAERITVHATVRRLPVSRRRIRECARLVLKSERCPKARITVVGIGTRRMLSLHQRHFSKNHTTDVISFPLHERHEPVEGEIYISCDAVKRQAKRYGVSRQNEFLRLVIHGILHLLGYGDTTQAQRKIMTEKENYFLAHGKL